MADFTHLLSHLNIVRNASHEWSFEENTTRTKFTCASTYMSHTLKNRENVCENVAKMPNVPRREKEHRSRSRTRDSNAALLRLVFEDAPEDAVANCKRGLSSFSFCARRVGSKVGGGHNRYLPSGAVQPQLSRKHHTLKLCTVRTSPSRPFRVVPFLRRASETTELNYYGLNTTSFPTLFSFRVPLWTRGSHANACRPADVR